LENAAKVPGDIGGSKGVNTVDRIIRVN
jgi:hypothetical protein